MIKIKRINKVPFLKIKVIKDWRLDFEICGEFIGSLFNLNKIVRIFLDEIFEILYNVFYFLIFFSEWLSEILRYILYEVGFAY